MRIPLIPQSLNNLKIITAIVVTIFVFVALFGFNVGMDMRQDGTMTGCMFDQSMVCPMSITGHITQWQQSFTSTQASNNNFILSIILLLASAEIILPFLQFYRYSFELPFDSSKIHKERNGLTKLFDYILRALSDGRLNPQVYKLSYLTR